MSNIVSLNTRKDFDGIIVKDPSLVVKIGLQYDAYKNKEECWKLAESEEKFKKLNLGSLIHEVDIELHGTLKTSFRYYTPESNIESEPMVH